MLEEAVKVERILNHCYNKHQGSANYKLPFKASRKLIVNVKFNEKDRSVPVKLDARGV